MNPRIFVSHATSVPSDREFARRLTDRLRADGIDVFFDETDVLPGDNWASKAGDALERATHLVLVLSPRGLRSPFVQHEIGYALGRKRFEGRLYPVAVQAIAETDLPAWADAVPWFDATKSPERVVDELATLLGRSKVRRAS